MGVITPFSDKPKPSPKPKMKATHEYEIEPGMWRSSHREYVNILGSSYPDTWNEENLCDKCGDYSDYFVEAYSKGIDGYHYTMTRAARMCNHCIMTVWFEILFKMRVPPKA